MQFIDYNSAPLALCLALPNWGSQITVEITLPATVTKARTTRTSRSNFGRSNRYTLEYQVDTSSAQESEDLRLWLLRLKTEPVAVPMWTDGVILSTAFNAGATALVKTALNPVEYGAEWIIFDPVSGVYEIVVVDAIDSGSVTLHTGCTLNWPAGTMMFPLLFATIAPADRPKFSAETDTLLSGKIKFTEDSPYARRLNPFPGDIPTVGAGVPEFSTLPLWNIQPQWSQVLDHTEVDILAKLIGLGRETVKYDAGNPTARGLEMEFFQDTRDGIASITRFFVDRRATTRPFMMPTFLGAMVLTQDLPIGGSPNLITIEASRYSDGDYAGHPGAPFVALVDPAGVDPQRINAVDGGNLTTAHAISIAHAKIETKIGPLLYVVFAEAKLSLIYDTDGQATTRIKVIEQPTEYASPQADLPERAKLYRVIEQVDVDVVRGLYTSYEKALVYNGQTYPPGPFEHKTVTADLKLGDKLDFVTWDFSEISGVAAANPVRKIVDGTLEGILWMDVFDVNALNPDDGTAFNEISGEVVGMDTTGKEWKGSLDPFGRFLDGDAPHFYWQKVCNVPLFSPHCAFGRPTMREDFKSLGTIAAKTVNTVDLDPVSGHPDPTAKDTDYFASGGWLEGGTGLTFERRTVTHSETISGKLRLSFGRALLWQNIGDQLSFWPGCNGAVDTCRLVFDNLLNFRGHPYRPIKNPSADIGAVQQSSGGKKG